VAAKGRDCSIANVLNVIGERWTLLALREIMLGARRFDEIVRNTGASRDILAARLRTLVGAGVLGKQQYEQRPPRYEYVLTEAGERCSRSCMGSWSGATATSPTVRHRPCGNTRVARNCACVRCACTVASLSSSTNCNRGNLVPSAEGAT
jgi:DNA-binding HxlR family transcriptional regulator